MELIERVKLLLSLILLFGLGAWALTMLVALCHLMDGRAASFVGLG